MVTKTAKPTQAQTKTQTTQPVVEEVQFDFRAFAESLGIELPSGKRVLAGVGVGILLSIAGGMLTGHLASYVFVGALLFSTSMFMAYLAMIIVFVIGVYASAIIASRAASYVATGQLERDCVRAKDWVVNLFQSKKIATVQS